MLRFAYDSASRRTGLTWPDGFGVSYAYDNANALTSVREAGATSGPGVLAQYAYDDLGRRTATTRGNGVVTRLSYDGASRLISLVQDLPGAAPDITQSFTFNPAGQIVSQSTDPASYGFNPQGSSETYTANNLNQYTGVGSQNVTHNANGATTARGGLSFAYDSDNRLVSGTGAGNVNLAYDPEGRLAQAESPSATTRFLYDGGQLIGEFDAAGALLRRYVPGLGADETIAWYEGAGSGDRRYILADVRNTPLAISYGDGRSDPQGYDTFGRPSATAIGRFGFTGLLIGRMS